MTATLLKTGRLSQQNPHWTVRCGFEFGRISAADSGMRVEPSREQVHLSDAGYELFFSSDSYAAIVCRAVLRQVNAFARSSPARRQRSASPIISAAARPSAAASP